MNTEIIIALISFIASIFGGLLVAVVNHLFTQKKTEAETKKLEAEIDKLKAETKKTLAESAKISSDTKHALGEAIYYDVTEINEKVIFDGSKSITSYDLISGFGEEDFDIQEGVILIQSNEWASYKLQTYMYNNKESTFIPKNEIVSGYRKFHVACELKVINASYSVSIFLWEIPEPEDGSDPSIDDRRVIVTDNEWIKKDFYFRAPPYKNYEVNIGAERQSGEGSLQIRNLIVAERVS